MVSVSRLTVLTALLLASAAVVAGGCSRQGEGERCDRKANNDADCDDGLVCVAQEQLLGGADEADRCCHADATRDSDSRCVRGTPRIDNNAGGAAGAGGSNTAGAAGTGTSGAGGTTSEAGSGGVAGDSSVGGAAGGATAGAAGAGGATAGAAGSAGAAGAAGSAAGNGGSAG